jgi:hypothetical protein
MFQIYIKNLYKARILFNRYAQRWNLPIVPLKHGTLRKYYLNPVTAAELGPRSTGAGKLEYYADVRPGEFPWEEMGLPEVDPEDLLDPDLLYTLAGPTANFPVQGINWRQNVSAGLTRAQLESDMELIRIGDFATLYKGTPYAIRGRVIRPTEVAKYHQANIGISLSGASRNAFSALFNRINIRVRDDAEEKLRDYAAEFAALPPEQIAPRMFVRKGIHLPTLIRDRDKAYATAMKRSTVTSSYLVNRYSHQLRGLAKRLITGLITEQEFVRLALQETGPRSLREVLREENRLKMMRAFQRQSNPFNVRTLEMRAYEIAVTEVMAYVNRMSVANYVAMGIEKFIWHTSIMDSHPTMEAAAEERRLPRTNICNVCEGFAGMVRKWEEPFGTNQRPNSERTIYLPPVHPLCRCQLRPYFPTP